MNKDFRDTYLKDFEAMNIVEILNEATSCKEDYNQAMFDVAMVAAYKKLSGKPDFEYEDDLDAAIAKTMIIAFAQTFLQLLDDFDAEPFYKILKEIADEDDEI